MCYQVIERYSSCHCLYYQHAVDRCINYGQRGHGVTQKIVLVSHVCYLHSDQRGSCRRGGGQRGSPRPLVESNLNGDDLSSNSSNSASIFNNNSTASTSLTTPADEWRDAVGTLFRDVLNEPSLRYLWPQVVRYSVTSVEAEKNISQFLQRFSRDLALEATLQVEKAACKFIGKARRTIAWRITECHATELGFSEPSLNALPPKDELAEAQSENEQKDDGSGILYEQISGFIFSKLNAENSAFESFVNNLKLFVARATSPPPLSAFGTVGRLLRQKSAALALSVSQKPAVPLPATRLEWSCVCIPGALHRGGQLC